MKIIELSFEIFDNFASNHPLRNYCQSSAYAMFMSEQGFNYDYIGYEDNGNIVAASLILYKRIGGMQKYAYAPKGFLIYYYNISLVSDFTKALTKKLKSKGIIFLKINPEIIIAELKYKNSFNSEYNKNVKIIDELKSIDYKRRREIKPLELIEPRISAYVNLKKYNQNKLNNETKEKIIFSQKKGLEYDIATSKEVKIFYDFIKDHTKKNINYYRNLLNIFNKFNMAELLLVKVNYKNFLIQAKEAYEIELENNNNYNKIIQENTTERNLNIKMESDKLLLQLKNNIVEATEGLKKGVNEYIAGAIIVKYQNRITIIESGYNPDFSNLYPDYYLYNKLFEIYAKDYDYIDLNGLSSDFSTGSEYYLSNQFKLEFNPNIYEYIGEFDYIINDFSFKNLQRNDAIAREMQSFK
ncbi:MAG: peptidoglycan bridge formation glycyltransferase FemA/FemB family protein [Bacilli bacterium]